jgi:hypothetical protein
MAEIIAIEALCEGPKGFSLLESLTGSLRPADFVLSREADARSDGEAGQDHPRVFEPLAAIN